MILFVAYGGGHVAMLAPVAEEAMRCGFPFTFLALTTAHKHLAARGIPYITFRDLPQASEDGVLEVGARLAEGLPKGGDVPWEESVAYLGCSFLDLQAEYGGERAMALYKERGRHAFLPVRTMRAFLQMLRPAVVVATNSPRAEKAAILAAGALGIPSVCAIDMFGRQAEWISRPAFATRLCTLNDSVRDMFIALGRRQEEIVVTGNPAFDRLFAPDLKERATAMRKTRGWNDGRITLLWASQVEPEKHPFADRRGDPELPRKIEEELRSFVRRNLGYRLVVRYHPSEIVTFLPGERVEFSPKSEDLALLLHAVDGVVVTASTVGLEASLIGKKVFSVDSSVISEDVLYSRIGVSVGVKVVGDLPEAIEASYNSTTEVDAKVISTRATAAEKVFNVIQSLLPVDLKEKE